MNPAGLFPIHLVFCFFLTCVAGEAEALAAPLDETNDASAHFMTWCCMTDVSPEITERQV